ncbi:glycoside hydrolase family 97 catalytic domain-containing protein [Dysgonomonas sp. Marseille-P4677]|uniref:glycoside hydrolase family 97 protein n=1 Tax=Dysgonomonas sp. Marseille-P4677 TaxID=2364790 RepID=UPI0019120E91|nr:glycoside hydrolase family 97 protein [Dysgonomonas sp. Marseille-P4677]MBK5720962.1 glycoside hydrolase family 97 catalytic domain-containing protein [Dysgonomonas sp. Marseille-P4677]
MKKVLGGLLPLFVIALLVSCSSEQNTLTSPNGKITVEINQDSTKVLKYTVKKDGATVIEPSTLGLVRNDADFSSLEVVNIGTKRNVEGTYVTPAEKRLNNKFKANEWDLRVKNPQGKEMTITFHLADNGLAFRYAFGETSTEEKTIEKENTSFKFATSAKAWLHPHDDVKNCWAQTCPSYEDNYITDVAVGTEAPKKAGWSFPALYKTGETWVLLTEAGLEPSYCGTRLAQSSPNGEYFIEFPQQGESVKPTDPVTPISKLPLYSPWRVIMLGGLNDIVESTIVTDLSEPSRIQNIDFINPGLAAWSWGIEKDNSVNYDRQKQYIDYASSMTWEYVLIDVEWDKRIGYARIQELIDYAKTKNVGIILWYNSSGDWNTTHYTPKSALLEKDARRTEFERISKMGVKGIKVDFWPGDAPSAIQYYYDVLQDAADYKLLINFHGTTVPRGWSRTFPNLMSLESIKGFEFITFAQETADLAPQHCATAIFARNVVGPMDFTPVCFGEIPGIQKRTSNGFEIALSVLFQSGIQHFVETPESMAKQPDYVQEYMKNVPRVWDDIKLIDGFPAKYAVLARRSGDKWYIAGINAETEIKSLNLDLSALNIQEEGTMITDGDTNRAFNQKQVSLNNGKLNVEIQPNGGFVIVF